MSVDLEPSELGFKRPFTHEVSQVLRLHNPHSDSVAFKVKTTAPKQYCVRPNSGRIEPNGSVEVQVLLQAMREDPPPDARCRDKFLVQSVGIPAAQSDSHNVAQIWSSIEQTAKSSIQEKKIRVTFLPADGSAPTNGVVGAASHHEDDHTSPPAYSSPSPAAVTPQRQAQGAVSTLDEKPAGSRSLGDARDSASNPASNNTSIFGSAAAAVSNAVPTSQDELRSQLAEAKAQIARLQESATEGLRQRNVIGGGDKSVGSSSSSGGLATQTQPAGGVPVQIVAALCLLCFLLAYFFF